VSLTVLPFLLLILYMLLCRYLIRSPSDWHAESSLRPIVLIPGLGLGLFQYFLFLTDLMNTFTDRPVLILIQPHISQNIFHPHFLTPMGRHDTAKRLARLIYDLGWMKDVSDRLESDETNDIILEVPSKDSKGQVRNGVTMLSHSK
jgi:hypothetical protein